MKKMFTLFLVMLMLVGSNIGFCENTKKENLKKTNEVVFTSESGKIKKGKSFNELIKKLNKKELREMTRTLYVTYIDAYNKNKTLYQLTLDLEKQLKEIEKIKENTGGKTNEK